MESYASLRWIAEEIFNAKTRRSEKGAKGRRGREYTERERAALPLGSEGECAGHPWVRKWVSGWREHLARVDPNGSWKLPLLWRFEVLKLVKQRVQVSCAVIDMMDLKNTGDDTVKDEVVGEAGHGD